jgi:hypothetical protein
VENHLSRKNNMFPSLQDVESFRSEFGGEAVLHRLPITNLSCNGTQAAAVIKPLDTKDSTLTFAWGQVRKMAEWILQHSAVLPSSERYMVIVGWSQSVRKQQGQIFKVGGERSALAAIAASTDWKKDGFSPLITWEKDVFSNR